MPHPPEIFETPTLTLRRVRVGDCDAILEAYGADPAVTRYLVWRPYSADAQDQLNDFLVGLEARWDSGSEYAWVMRPPASNAPSACSRRASTGKRSISAMCLPKDTGTRA